MTPTIDTITTALNARGFPSVAVPSRNGDRTLQRAVDTPFQCHTNSAVFLTLTVRAPLPEGFPWVDLDITGEHPEGEWRSMRASILARPDAYPTLDSVVAAVERSAAALTRAWNAAADATAPVLVPVDLMRGRKHTHPDIDPTHHSYLACIAGRWQAGRFGGMQQWLTFYPHGHNSMQFDTPGTNSSMWERLYRVEDGRFTYEVTHLITRSRAEMEEEREEAGEEVSPTWEHTTSVRMESDEAVIAASTDHQHPVVLIRRHDPVSRTYTRIYPPITP